MGRKGNEIGPLGASLIFIAFTGAILSLALTHWDFAPAKGSAYGYIYYQEKSGIFQLDTVCWKDTPYVQNCEWFDPLGKRYEPGRYLISYECGTFVWAWEKPDVCSITNATRLGE